MRAASTSACGNTHPIRSGARADSRPGPLQPTTVAVGMLLAGDSHPAGSIPGGRSDCLSRAVQSPSIHATRTLAPLGACAASDSLQWKWRQPSRLMSLDFEVKRCTRKCAKTERAFDPGETFYSILRPAPASDEVIREDFCAEAWSGPPEDIIGWWMSQLPDPDARKVEWAPNDVILHYFEKIHADPNKAETCFVLTLLMIRRRLMRLEESQTDEQGNEIMVLFCPRTEKEYRVASQNPSPESAENIQTELVELLFAKTG